MVQNAVHNAVEMFEALFAAKVSSKYRWLEWTFLVLLFASGIVLWYWFLQHGQLLFNYQDWALVTAPRLAILKDALMSGVLPLHASDPAALGGVTDRFIATPDTILAPQAVLLRFLDLRQYITFNQFLLYSVGFAGLYWFRRKYSLSLFAFAVLVLLFNYNGHILSHISVGHATWGGYFLFPWFAMLVICLLDGDHSWSWVAKMSLLLFVIWLNGSFHQFVWCLLFLAVLALTSWRHALTILKASAFALALSLVRLLPPSLLVGDFRAAYDFILGGYPTAASIVDALTVMKVPPSNVFTVYDSTLIGGWEFSLYIGLLATGFLAVFGIFYWLKKHENGFGHYQLVLPTLALIVFSVGQVFDIVKFFQIPLLDGERVSSRIISIPFVFLVLIAAIEFQRWVDSRPLSRIYLAGIAGLAFLNLHDQWQYFKAWRLARAMHAFKEVVFNPQAFFSANHPDPAYTQLLVIGAAGSLLSLLLLLGMVWMEKRGTLQRIANQALASSNGQASSPNAFLRTNFARFLVPSQAAEDRVEIHPSAAGQRYR